MSVRSGTWRPSRLRACHFHEPPTGTVSVSCCTRHWRGVLPYSGETAVVLEKKRLSEVLAPLPRGPGHSRRAELTLYQAAEMQSGGTPDLLGDRARRLPRGAVSGTALPCGPIHDRATVRRSRERALSPLGRVSLPEGRGIGGRAGARAMGSGKTALIQRFLDEELDPEPRVDLEGAMLRAGVGAVQGGGQSGRSLSRYLMSRPVELVSRVLPRRPPAFTDVPVLSRVEMIAALEDVRRCRRIHSSCGAGRFGAASLAQATGRNSADGALD